DTFALTIEDDNTGGPSLVFNDPSASVFDGSTGSAIELPHQSAYEIDTGTIAFSFNADNTSGQQGLFTKDAKNFQGGGNHMLVYLKGDDLLVRVQNGIDSEILRFDGIQAGTFYDVAVTFGPGGATLWVDGNQVDSDSIVTNWSDNVEFIQWGARGWGSQTGEAGFDAVFEGVIANKQIYDGELSSGQIASLAAGGASAPASFSTQLAPSSFSLTALPPAEEESEDAGAQTAQTSIAAARSIAPDPGTMVFDGTAATVVELSHRIEYELDQGFVGFTFNAADTDGSQGLFSKDAKFFDGGGNHLLVSLEGTTLTVRLQDGSSSEFLTYEGVRAGVNYDVAVTFGPDGAQLSVNGVEVDSSLLMVDLSQNTEYVQWGARGEDSQTGEAGYDSPFEGSISNAEIAPVELE
ncbi:MAG: LamG-like jellyroll fold domain-containing protein, partial [Pseudomonadota bacterium]